MNEEKKRPEQETKAPAQIDITPGEPTTPAAEEPRRKRRGRPHRCCAAR